MDIIFYLREDNNYNELFTTTLSIFVESRYKEINSLLKKRIFEIVYIDNILERIYIFNSRFVDKIKNKGTNTIYKKLRLVAQVYNNLLKDIILT
jgi:hypothetical protein